MAGATVVELAKAVVSLIQAAIDDPLKPLGAGLVFDVKRVPLLRTWTIADNEERIRIRVATLGTDGAPEETRTSYCVKYVIPVSITRRLSPTEIQGEDIDDCNEAVLATCDRLTEFIQCLTQIFAARENINPAMPGLHFRKWTHQDPANRQGWIFNPAALSERRQYESTILLHYEAQFPT